MKRLFALIAVFLILFTPAATAYPLERYEAELVVPPAPVYLKFSSNSTLRTDTNPGTELRLPPGYFMDEPTWNKLNDDYKASRDQVTRLTAENFSLKSQASSNIVGWKLVVVAALVGISGGIYIGTKF